MKTGALKIILVLLFIISAGEIGYLVYLSSNKVQTNNNPVEPTTFTENNSQNQDKLEREKLIDNNIIVSSVLTDTFIGTIAKIELDGKFADSGYEYKVNIGLKAGDKVTSVVLPKNVEARIKVFQVKDSQTIPIKIEDIRADDRIEMVRKIDALV